MKELTPRQIQAVSGIALGMSDEEIARKLGVRYGTMREHLRAARDRTGARNRTELVVLALREGWIR